MSDMRRDEALSAARAEERLAAALRAAPWRAVAAEAARHDPRHAGRIAAVGGAAPLALLALDAVRDALVVGDVWAAIAVPLARHCRVRALLATPAAAAICTAVAAQEGTPCRDGYPGSGYLGSRSGPGGGRPVPCPAGAGAPRPAAVGGRVTVPL